MTDENSADGPTETPAEPNPVRVVDDEEIELSYTTDIDIRFSDFDPLGHVNNAVYLNYLELARLRYFSDVADISLLDLESDDETGPGIVLANADLDFRAPVDDFGRVTVSLGTVHIGTSSFTIEYEITFRDTVVLTAETTQVVIDMAADRPTPIPDAWRRRLVAFEEHF